MIKLAHLSHITECEQLLDFKHLLKTSQSSKLSIRQDLQRLYREDTQDMAHLLHRHQMQHKISWKQNSTLPVSYINSLLI